MPELNNSTAMGALEASIQLSKVGSKDKEVVKRLAKIISYIREAINEFFISRDALLRGYAKHDDNGDIVVKETKDGQIAEMENEVEYNLKSGELMREPVKANGTFPEPLRWSDLERFAKFPDADMISRLGPFVTID